MSDDDASVLLPAEVAAIVAARKALRRRVARRKWYESHQEQANEYQQRWRAAHPAEVRASLAAWQAANAGRVREYSRRHYLKAWEVARGGRPCVACAGMLTGRDPSTLEPPHERCVAELSSPVVVAPQLWPLPTMVTPWEAADLFAGAACDLDPWWA